MTPAPSLQTIPLAQIVSSALNPRRHFDPQAVSEIAASMKLDGQLTPITVRPHPKKPGTFELAAGETRWRAAKQAGLAAMIAYVQPMDDARFALYVTSENLHRSDLRPLEEAQAFRTQMEVAGLSIASIAERHHQKPEYVRDRLRLFKLCTEAVALLDGGRIGISHALELAKLTQGEQRQAINEALFRTVNVDASVAAELGVEDVRRAIPVEELRSWINVHCRLDLTHEEALHLFPEAVKAQDVAAHRKLKRPLYITYLHQLHPDARGSERVLGPRSWARADGTSGAPQCSHAQPAVVIAGPYRGDGFLVCTNKQACRKHWGAEIAEREKASTAAAKPGADSAADRERKEREAEERQRADARRLELALRAALPEIRMGLVAFLEDCAAGGRSKLAAWLLAEARHGRKATGKAPASAEEVLRTLATIRALDIIDRNSHYAGGVKEMHRALAPLGFDPMPAIEREFKKTAPAAAPKRKKARAHK